jgi:hypothetical protein
MVSSFVKQILASFQVCSDITSSLKPLNHRLTNYVSLGHHHVSAYLPPTINNHWYKKGTNFIFVESREEETSKSGH